MYISNMYYFSLFLNEEIFLQIIYLLLIITLLSNFNKTNIRLFFISSNFYNTQIEIEVPACVVKLYVKFNDEKYNEKRAIIFKCIHSSMKNLPYIKEKY
ncbi:hypothetical protein V1478_003776 [Vespula squamosa]|uniref:Uncharacterized protein n=1 Tax=Vespula squamosa TaxID=30214 RepID=A0ABD2BMS7_VESSQ